ncbi:MAG: hypothetical protein Fur0018_01040 [Anaerolineales bacterium]
MEEQEHIASEPENAEAPVESTPPTQADSLPVEQAPENEQPPKGVLPPSPDSGQSSFTAPPIQPQPSRASQVARLILRWAIGLFIVFVLGYLTAFFTIYKSASAQLQTRTTEVQTINRQVEDIQKQLDASSAEIERLKGQLQNTSDERDRLQAEVNAAELRFNTLRALVDVQGARLALQAEDTETAGIYLAKVPAYLESMSSLAPADVLDSLKNMQTRLSLAVEGLTSDPATAAADLSVLADWLRQFETTLR